MKKTTWIIVTVAACAVWVLLVGVIWVGLSILVYSTTGGRTNLYEQFTVPIILMFVGFAVLIFLSRKLWHSYSIRCPNCKKWGAIFLDNTKILKQEDVFVPIETKSRNLQGNVYGTQEQYVPGHRTTYRDTYRCKYCGNTTSATRTRKKANI